MPNTKGSYSIKEIQQGFERFNRQNGHYPSADEIDACNYLPAVRQIQRRFGGLSDLKKSLGIIDMHYGKGKFRTKIAVECCRVGFVAERELEKILVGYFGEPFVHIERPISQNNRKRYDFFVYAKDIKFGVDIFYSNTKRHIQVNINSKLNNYLDVKDSIYFVMANKLIDQSVLDQIAKSKPNKPMPNNIRLLTIDNFVNAIQEFKPIGLL